MKNIKKIKEIIKQHRNILSERFGIAIVAIFGFYVKGEQEQSSVIDLLADILRPISLLEMVGSELYLSELPEIKVDLVPKRSVRKELRDNILEVARRI